MSTSVYIYICAYLLARLCWDRVGVASGLGWGWVGVGLGPGWRWVGVGLGLAWGWGWGLVGVRAGGGVVLGLSWAGVGVGFGLGLGWVGVGLRVVVCLPAVQKGPIEAYMDVYGIYVKQIRPCGPCEPFPF